MNDPVVNFLALMTQRFALSDAWFSETGLRPSQTLLCQRVSEDGSVRTWFEPKPHQEPWTYLLFGQQLAGCRDKSLELRVITTQKALLTFVRQSEMPQVFVAEAENNLTIINYP